MKSAPDYAYGSFLSICAYTEQCLGLRRLAVCVYGSSPKLGSVGCKNVLCNTALKEMGPTHRYVNSRNGPCAGLVVPSGGIT